MAGTALPSADPSPRSTRPFATTRVREALRDAGPPLLFGLRLWASVSLALHIAFWLELDNAYWAGTSAALVCQPQLGASLRKGWFRMIGTVGGAIVVVVLAACFPQGRVGFLIGLAAWGGLCAGVATLLRNFAAYAVSLAGYSVAIIANDILGATGGVQGETFTFAITRVTEICIGIVSAGIVLAGTDLGHSRRRLAKLFGDLFSGITSGFTRTLASAGPDFPDTQPVRRDFIRRTITLDPLIDQTIGESSQIRYHTPVLQKAVDGFFTALSGWRAIANHLVRLAPDRAAEAAEVLQRLPPELLVQAVPAGLMVGPIRLHRIVGAAIERLIDLPAETPSVRLLADKAAMTLAGISDALNGLALLVADPARPVPRLRGARLRVADWLPALVNAGRAFVMIGAAALFWIITAWPNGVGAIVWVAIGVILLSPRAEQVYDFALRFAVGNVLAAIFAAVILFAVLPLPQMQTFAGFSLALGAYLVPVGALAAQPWQTALFVPMVGNIVPLIAPANQMSYNPGQFYNTALALVGGSVAAALSFRLLPPLSPAFRIRRLLALTLRDLRRLARGHTPGAWEGHIHGRLAAMPNEATPLQRAYLLAALSVGSEIIQFRQIAHELGLGARLDPALAAIATGSSKIAVAHLAQFDAELAGGSVAGVGRQTLLRLRASVIVLSEVLTQHAFYFDGGAAR